MHSPARVVELVQGAALVDVRDTSADDDAVDELADGLAVGRNGLLVANGVSCAAR